MSRRGRPGRGGVSPRNLAGDIAPGKEHARQSNDTCCPLGWDQLYLRCLTASVVGTPFSAERTGWPTRVFGNSASARQGRDEDRVGGVSVGVAAGRASASLWLGAHSMSSAGESNIANRGEFFIFPNQVEGGSAGTGPQLHWYGDSDVQETGEHSCNKFLIIGASVVSVVGRTRWLRGTDWSLDLRATPTVETGQPESNAKTGWRG